jgi:Enoyl-CoA hydratase/isomerase
MMQAQTPNARIEREGAVLCVTFDRPEKKNALTGAMYLAATQALHDADRDPSIGAIVFAGSGMFTAGNDIADFLEAREEAEEFPAFTFIKTLAACETPLVAAIGGIAIGIGATLMLHSDLVYVAPGTVFRLPFVDLGLVPEAASSLLLPPDRECEGDRVFVARGRFWHCGSGLPMPSFRRASCAASRSKGQGGSRQNPARHLPPRAASCTAMLRKFRRESRKRRGCFPSPCGRTTPAPPSRLFSVRHVRYGDKWRGNCAL